MSLDWSVERMKNYDVLTTLLVNNTTEEDSPENMTRKWLPLTEALIWATMSVGINSITEKNWQEFYLRLNLLEKVTGSSIRCWNAPEHYQRFITPLEVYIHIGLSTNASNKTQSEFMKDLLASQLRANKKALEETPALYQAHSLEHLNEETYQSLWQQKETYTLDDKLKARNMVPPIEA